jgi:hypothetical protein
MFRNRIIALTIIAALIGVLAAPQPTHACEIVCAIIIATVFTVAGIAISLNLKDDTPEIGDITVDIPDQQGANWYVGDYRAVNVEVPVSFGHIRWKDVGKVKISLELPQGEVSKPVVRKYTVRGDDRSDTHTWGRWEGKVPAGFTVQATTVAPSVNLIIHVEVQGEKGSNLTIDKKKTVRKDRIVPLQFLFPFEEQPQSGLIGWLEDPTTATIYHHECFDQSLSIRNFSWAFGQIGKSTIGNTTKEDATINYRLATGTSRRTELVRGEVNHDPNAVGHACCVDFRTPWSLVDPNNSENIRLFLNKKPDWTYSGQEGPSGTLDNTCNGGGGTCDLIPTVIDPNRRAVNESYTLHIISPSEDLKPASNREILITDTWGFSAVVSTDPNGVFSISAPALGPLVSLQLVYGTESELYEPRTMELLNVQLLDSSVEPQFTDFYIEEKEAPPISGRVVDNFGNELRAEISAINPTNPTEEILLDSIDSAFAISGVGIGKIGYPSTTVVVRVEPDFNRDYTQDSVEIPVSTNSGPIDLGDIVFSEIASYQGPVLFRGRYAVRCLQSDDDHALPGLVVAVEGAGAAVTDSGGLFSIIIPGPGIREVTFPNATTLGTPCGTHLKLDPGTSWMIEFGRGGAIADMGYQEVNAFSPSGGGIPTVSQVGLVVLASLLLLGGLAALRRRRARCE